MSKDTGGFAFPAGFHPDGNTADQQGMTLRDYFAAKAMQGMMANGGLHGSNSSFSISAYAIADAMLAERSKT